MKTVIVFTISTFVFCYSCLGQDSKKNDLKVSNLKGMLKSLSVNSFKVTNEGNEMQKGKIIGKSTSFYNDKGNIIEGYDCSYSIDSSNTNSITFIKDNKVYKTGSPNHSVSYDSSKTKNIYKYDENGRKKELNIYKSDSSLIYRITFKYDDNGNIIEKDYYNIDGSLNRKWTYKFDNYGNEIEYNSSYSSGTHFNSKAILQYDDKGNNTEVNLYNPDGALKEKDNYKYNDKGNSIEMNTYNPDGTLKDKYTFKYDYDKTGNWIKETEFKNNIPQFITEREITYY